MDYEKCSRLNIKVEKCDDDDPQFSYGNGIPEKETDSHLDDKCSTCIEKWEHVLEGTTDSSLNNVQICNVTSLKYFSQDESTKSSALSGPEFVTQIKQEPNDEQANESHKILQNSNTDSLQYFPGNLDTLAKRSSKSISSSVELKVVTKIKQEPKVDEQPKDTPAQESCEGLQNSSFDSLKNVYEGHFTLPEKSSKLCPSPELVSPHKTLVEESCQILQNSNDDSSKYFAVPLGKKSSSDFPFQHGDNRWHKRLHWCKVCGKGFDTRSKLRLHVAIHSEKRANCTSRLADGSIKKPHSCDECGKVFRSRSLLSTHFAYWHSEERPLLCEVCGKTFKTVTNLRLHLTLHSGEKHLCQLCGKEFKQKYKLARHFALRHQEERLQVCDVCGKAFKTRSCLRSHLYTHSKELPYPCDLCEKAFKRRSYLTAHLSTHSEARPYACELCGTAFKARRNLTKHHALRHSSQRLHSCEQCEKTFKTKQSLKRHIYAQHTKL